MIHFITTSSDNLSPPHSSSFQDWECSWLKATGQSLWICGQMITAKSLILVSFCITSTSCSSLSECVAHLSGTVSYTRLQITSHQPTCRPCVGSAFSPSSRYEHVTVLEECLSGESFDLVCNQLYFWIKDDRKERLDWWSLELCTDPGSGISNMTPPYAGPPAAWMWARLAAQASLPTLVPTSLVRVILQSLTFMANWNWEVPDPFPYVNWNGDATLTFMLWVNSFAELTILGKRPGFDKSNYISLLPHSLTPCSVRAPKIISKIFCHISISDGTFFSMHSAGGNST